MKASYLALIFGSTLLNVSAQLSLKYGLYRIGHFELKLTNLYLISFKMLKDPYVFFGLGCYVLSVFFWVLTLSRVEISYAYPMTSVGYILITLAGSFLFQEHLSFTRMLGIGIILVGVFFVSRS